MNKLFFIILSQFLSGSIWFAGNVAYEGQGMILSAVQLGFIAGTLSFAVFNISDRYSPARVFCACALAGAAFNLAGALLEAEIVLLMFTRFCCGVALAGIYPVGMKIAASWFPQTISRALGFLVGALVLASGFPWLIRAMGWGMAGEAWAILGVTSAACVAGGLIQVFLVGDGPHLPRASRFDARVLGRMFAHKGFLGASLGYFGHMWELYAVFAYVPLLFQQVVTPGVGGNPSFWTFGFFVSGFLGCAMGGLVALKTGSRKVARTALLLSGLICLMTPWIPKLPAPAALFLLMVWGATVVADSPQFSALNTRFAPKAYVGSALTLVNCIGFLITIVTIELLAVWIRIWGTDTAFLPLVIGPFLGWVALKPGRRRGE